MKEQRKRERLLGGGSPRPPGGQAAPPDPWHCGLPSGGSRPLSMGREGAGKAGVQEQSREVPRAVAAGDAHANLWMDAPKPHTRHLPGPGGSVPPAIIPTVPSKATRPPKAAPSTARRPSFKETYRREQPLGRLGLFRYPDCTLFTVFCKVSIADAFKGDFKINTVQLDM